MAMTTRVTVILQVFLPRILGPKLEGQPHGDSHQRDGTKFPFQQASFLQAVKLADLETRLVPPSATSTEFRLTACTCVSVSCKIKRSMPNTDTRVM